MLDNSLSSPKVGVRYYDFTDRQDGRDDEDERRQEVKSGELSMIIVCLCQPSSSDLTRRRKQEISKPITVLRPRDYTVESGGSLSSAQDRF